MRLWPEICQTGYLSLSSPHDGFVIGQSVLDVRVGLEEVAVGGINVSPWVALINAFDEDYVASVAVNAFGGRFFEPGIPQSFQVGLRARFGGSN